MCELALTKAQSEKRKAQSESAKRKRVLTPLYCGLGALQQNCGEKSTSMWTINNSTTMCTKVHNNCCSLST